MKPTIPSLRFAKMTALPKGVRLSRKFKSRGFMLNLKWVFSFIARRKLEPMDLRNEGFNVNGMMDNAYRK